MSDKLYFVCVIIFVLAMLTFSVSWYRKQYSTFEKVDEILLLLKEEKKTSYICIEK